jgi:hypothetical protein
MAFGGDYLPVVGPPPLRFEALPSPSTVRFDLPPLESAPATVATNKVAVVVAKTNPPPAPLEVVAPPPTPAPAVPPAESPAETAAISPPKASIAPFATPDAPLYYPQMFLQYFTHGAGTNTPGASVVVPMSFLPPVPLVPPSSSATYEVTPAPKP